MTPTPEERHTWKGAFSAALVMVLAMLVLHAVGPNWLVASIVLGSVAGLFALLVYVVLRDLVVWPLTERMRKEDEDG